MEKRMSVTSGFDLNLLEIFEEVYRFNSVTKAAKSLKLTPSSVSQSLQKLRLFFSDPLFVRTGQGLTATTMSEAIHVQLSKYYDGLLDELRALATSASKDILIVHCSTYFSLRILPYITRWVEEHAPGCKVVHRDFLKSQYTSEDLLLQRGVDLVFDMLPAYSFALNTCSLIKEDVTFFCRTDHPRLGSHISLEEAKLEKFALLDSNGLDVQLGEVQINQQFGERDFKFTSGSMLAIAAMVASTDTVGVLPIWLYEKLKSAYDIRALDCEFTLNPVSIYMMYSKISLQNTIFQQLAHWLENDFIHLHEKVNN